MDRFIFYSVLALVLIFPVFFGGNVNWAWDTFSALASLLLVIWAAGFLARKDAGLKLLHQIRIPFLLFTLVLLWISIQAFVAMPEGWGNPLWAEAGVALGTHLPTLISIDPARSASGLLRLFAYGTVFFLIIQTAARPKQVTGALKAFAITSTIIAIYGLYTHLGGANTVLGEDKIYYQEVLTGTFINRNSYATFAGLGFLTITALLFQGWLRVTSRGAGGRKNSFFLNLGAFLSSHWWLILSFAIVITALLLTGSRAGIGSTLIAVLFLLLIFILKRRHSVGKGLLGVGGFIVILVAIIAFSGDLVVERLGVVLFGDDTQAVRLALYQQGFDIISIFPLTGTGYDTYPYAFYMFRGMEGEFGVRSIHAHSTYIENAIELGIPAAIVLGLTFVSLFWLCYKGIRRRRRYFPIPALGFVATLLIGLHSLVDFSMEMPAIAATYALLVGLAVSQCWPQAKPYSPPRRPLAENKE